jgi:hypothetical protein
MWYACTPINRKHNLQQMMQQQQHSKHQSNQKQRSTAGDSCYVALQGVFLSHTLQQQQQQTVGSGLTWKSSCLACPSLGPSCPGLISAPCATW